MDKGLIVHTVIFNDKQEVLITKRAISNDVLPEYWDIPGGTLENGEDPLVGAIREVKEETSLDIQEASLFFEKSNVDLGKNKQFVTLVFLAKHPGTAISLNPEEHDQYQWINISEITKYKVVNYLKDCLKFLVSKNHTILNF